MQPVSHFSQQFLNDQTIIVRNPQPAHNTIVGTVATGPYLSNNRFVGPASLQAPNMNFDPRAQPLTPHMENLMMRFSNVLPGVDYNTLMHFVESQKNQSIPNVNFNQGQFQDALQAASLMNNHHQHSTGIPANSTTASLNNLVSGIINNQPRPAPPPRPSEDEMAAQDLEANAEADEEFQEVETYSDYWPAKLTIGHPHPDPVVETSSLSTVEPPDITYKLSLPADVINKGCLSSLQLESVIYANQQHEKMMADGKTRRGFLIGDGAGVGKGRTIAGIIYENYLCGRKKSIWLSVSTDLRLDAIRDLRDIGLKDFDQNKVRLLKDFTYGRKISVEEGVMFLTYSGLVSKSQSIKGNLGTRLGQLVAWVGSKFDGVIVFDECHKAKNISTGKTNTKKVSKAAECVLELQNKLPNARVVYASATGASETRHLGYMIRLGMWGEGTAYPNFNIFCEAIEKRGVGAMELVAVDLKMRGSYIARQLSFKTTNFSIQIAPLTNDFIKLYDECVDMWALALAHFREAETIFQGHKKLIRTLWSSFWAAHQKFFKYLCISAKVPVVVDIARQALEDGKCVVVGLQSTGEAKTLEALEDGGITEFVSTARATFESLIDNHFPVPERAKRAKRAPSSTDSELNFPPTEIIGNVSSSNLSRSSSGSTVNDLWGEEDSCKFVVEDGVAMPIVKKRKSKSGANHDERKNKPEMLRNQRALQELVEAKKAREKAKSTRAIRAKRRATVRQGVKSRIKRTLDSDSDTEISNPLSSSSSATNRTSGSDETYKGESESEEEDEQDEDTIYEDSGSDDDLCVIGTKKARASRMKKRLSKRRDQDFINDDSDGDIQITAVKPKRRQEVVFIESDGAEDDYAGDQAEEADEVDRKAGADPMIEHGPRLIMMRDQMLSKLESVASRLPNNTLDDLIDRLGGPDEVAEMTGRKGRVVKNSYGMISYKQRNEIDSLDTLNIAEKERFMNGEKFIAIISEAASSGISLQADKRVKNQRRRVHVTIELPWSADRAIQQFGRTHRSNQTTGPEYVFIISEMAGERRFASVVAKRLESLGALTHGDRRATSESRDLSQFNISSKFCRPALERLGMYLEGCSINDADSKIVPDYRGNFLRDARQAYVGAGLGKWLHRDVFLPEAHALQINLFLNRILGMKVRIQNAIFKLFTDYVDRLIMRKKIAGQYDAGILELNSETGKTHVEAPEHFWLRTKTGNVMCTLRNIKVERGIAWERALEMYRERSDDDRRSGFYISINPISKCVLVFLIIREGVDLFRVYKPNVGRQIKPEFYENIIQGRNKQVSMEQAEKIWRKVYESTDKYCIHLCFFKGCKRMEAKMKCSVGLRHRYYTILSGSILTAWPYLEKMVPQATAKIQIVRLRLDVHNRVIGPIIPQDHLDAVKRALRKGETEGVQF